MPSYNNISSLLQSANLAIENARNDADLQKYLSQYGYTPERIQRGLTLYETAVAAQARQQAKFGEKVAATATLQETSVRAKKSYMRLLKLARIAFNGNAGVATKLRLNGPRKQSLSGWLFQARQFYSNAFSDPDLLGTLAEYGVTPLKLEEGQADIEAVVAANLAQDKAKGEAREATQVRDAAINALKNWLREFFAIAKIALEEDPQLLEILGVVAKE